MIALSATTIVFIVLGAAMVVGFAIAIWIRHMQTTSSEPLAPASEEVSPEDELETLRKNGGNSGLRITGELRVSGNTVLPAGFVMDGSLTVLEGGRLDALVEVRGDATLEPGAQLARPLVVHGDLNMGRGARVPACHVGGAVHLHPEAKVDTLLECGTLYLH